MTFINWLVHHTSFGMLILTFFYVVFTGRILTANLQMLSESKEMRNQEMMPNVITYFDVTEEGDVTFIMQNIGKSIALNTSIKMEPIVPFPIKNPLHESNLIRETLRSLAPNQALNTFVGKLKELSNDDEQLPILKVAIEFMDQEKLNYHFVYTLNLNILNKESQYDIHDLTKEIGHIRELLENYLKTHSFTSQEN